MQVLASIQAPRTFVFPGAVGEGNNASLHVVSETEAHLSFEDGSKHEVVGITTFGDLESDYCSFIIITEEGTLIW